MKKLWDKGKPLNQLIEKFTTEMDRSLDLELVKWDIAGSIAHITMLEKIGLLSNSDWKALKEELIKIYNEQVLTDSFVIESGVEDVHSQVEMILTNRLGDVGKKIHSGRSRNDQVLLDTRLYLRDEIREITIILGEVFSLLIKKSNENKDVLLPGYTHLQVAMPSSFGLWFGAWAECLCDDLLLFKAAYDMTDQNPLGSAAGYGSSFPLDRTFTTELMGFNTLSYNVVNAQLGRGKTERTFAVALAGVASTCSRMMMDVCLYNSQNFQFLDLPEDFTTGSSIMPHKKNPDVFEILRGRFNKLQNLPNTINQVLNNLPSGYHRDLQVVKEELFPAISEFRESLEVLLMALDGIKVKKGLLDDPKYQLLFTVENVNTLVKNGVPFRDAYKQIGMEVENGTYQPEREINHTHEGSIGNLCNDQISLKWNKRVADLHLEKGKNAIDNLLTN